MPSEYLLELSSFIKGISNNSSNVKKKKRFEHNSLKNYFNRVENNGSYRLILRKHFHHAIQITTAEKII